MFVITADQIDSRNDRDRASEMIARLNADFGPAFLLPPDQTSGDEIQLLTADADAALNVVLALHRAGHWSIGLGIGDVRTPLPASTRQASGGAFVAARDAVNRSKRTEARFALEAAATAPPGDPTPAADEVEAIVTMLLLLRQRRTNEGWEAIELLRRGLPQVQIAAALGISTAAVSQRLKSAQWRVEEAVRPALVKLVQNLDRATTESERDA
ncbi:sigma-70 family RNA polymerase sigma factor [Cryobacterium sp. Sr8]|uniref:sigma-70 family RNA polymerase sigma factor n=1 Tax=Cryobacterium sp. Sr8 TaxID=1259203 RepID=UPI00106BC418|nr:sigma-70 family RNA polymerase sigma factor [Cryobacterium sp. Sr8]TFD82031.1 sigma-70 family RNA polymerase sigma factor [Cryobacterium sp. Sr8]